MSEARAQLVFIQRGFDAHRKLVDVVNSEHAGSYTIQDVGVWSYYNGMVSNERDSLENLIVGICPDP